jgi:hypothetical protein
MTKLLNGRAAVWPALTALLTSSQKHLAAVAFVSKEATRLLPLRADDILVVDMSAERVKTGATNPWAVEEFVKNGVSVFTYRGLHAKLFVLGDRVVVGSTNVSNASKAYLDEAALVTDDQSIRRQAEKYIEDLSARALPVTALMLKKRKAEFRETGWHGRPPSQEPPGSWALKMMKAIAPKNVVASQGSPYIEPTYGKAIRRFYLKDSDGAFVLELYPGDTMEQARPLYEKLDVGQMMKLISRNTGWEVKPNFHLGYQSKGLAHTQTDRNVASYTKFWKKPPGDLQLGSTKRKGYANLARRLLKYKMLHTFDVPNLKREIQNRPLVSLRPGIKLTFTWNDTEPTAKEVVKRINEALRTWGESVLTVGKGKARKLVVQQVAM